MGLLGEIEMELVVWKFFLRVDLLSREKREGLHIQREPVERNFLA